MSKALKTILIFLIVIVIGAIAYILLGENLNLPTPTLSSPLQSSNTGENVSALGGDTVSDINADQIGQEFLTQLLNIRSIKLRDDIFSSPAFISLTDFTIELNQLGNEGRQNPFAPFGVDGAIDSVLPLDLNNPDASLLPLGGNPETSQQGINFGPGEVSPTPNEAMQMMSGS